MLKLTYLLWITMLFSVISCKQTVHLYPITKGLEKVDTVYLTSTIIDLNPVFLPLDSQFYKKEKLEVCSELAEIKLHNNFNKIIANKFQVRQTQDTFENLPLVSGNLFSFKSSLDSIYISKFSNCQSFDKQDSIFFVDYGKVIGLNEIEFRCINDSFAQININSIFTKNEFDSSKTSSYRYYWINLVETDLYTKRKRFESKFGDIAAGILTGLLLGQANAGSGSGELEKVKLYSAIYNAAKREIIYFNYLTSERTRGLFYPHPEKRRTWRSFIRKIKKDLPEDVFVVVPKGI